MWFLIVTFLWCVIVNTEKFCCWQMMQEMGNSRGRAVYEANIPDGFRRPQTDSYPFTFTQGILCSFCYTKAASLIFSTCSLPLGMFPRLLTMKYLKPGHWFVLCYIHNEIRKHDQHRLNLSQSHMFCAELWPRVYYHILHLPTWSSSTSIELPAVCELGEGSWSL